MANLIQHLTSISQSGPSPGRRLLALVLCAMLVLGSTFPGFALAGEADSEGEGTAPPVEVPIAPPDFDPGDEETGLEEEAPPSSEEEGGAVEAEVEAPAPDAVTGAATEAPIEAAPSPPVAAPAPEPAPVQQQAEPSEPVANQSIAAPKDEQVERSTASESAGSSEAAPPAEPALPEAPPSPQPVASTPPDLGRSLAGKNTYVVQPGDCLWHIAADLLPGSADTQAIAEEVGRLWRLNEGRIGTGDPNLIYAGTELRLG